MVEVEFMCGECQDELVKQAISKKADISAARKRHAIMANSRVPKRLALEDISNHQNNGLTVNEPVPLGKDGASVLLLAAEASENTELGAGAGGTSNVNMGAPPCCGGESSPDAALPSKGRAPKGLAKLLEEL